MNFSDDGDLRPRAYDLIVFDWDGTLFDSTALIVRSIQLACEDMGLPVPARHEAAYVIGLGLHDALAHVAPTLSPEQVPAMPDLRLAEGVALGRCDVQVRRRWIFVADDLVQHA